MSLSVEQIERVLMEHDTWTHYQRNVRCTCDERLDGRPFRVQHRRHVAQALKAALDAEKETR